MIRTQHFVRKPFYVDAVQVTSENMAEVAEWCNGAVRDIKNQDGSVSSQYIKVQVSRAITDRQTKAFAGDWVLKAGSGFKVYTPKAFEKSFDPVDTISVSPDTTIDVDASVTQ